MSRAETIIATLPNGVEAQARATRGERWLLWIGRKDKTGFTQAHASEAAARDFLRRHSNHQWVALWPIRYVVPAAPAGRKGKQ